MSDSQFKLFFSSRMNYVDINGFQLCFYLKCFADLFFITLKEIVWIKHFQAWKVTTSVIRSCRTINWNLVQSFKDWNYLLYSKKVPVSPSLIRHQRRVLGCCRYLSGKERGEGGAGRGNSRGRGNSTFNGTFSNFLRCRIFTTWSKMYQD